MNMKVNSRILETLSEFKIGAHDGLTYLLALYHDLVPSYIPLDIRQKISASRIVEFTNTGKQWNIPLFEEQQTAFDWVEKEYIPLFEPVGKATNKREALTRMKQLFAKNPDIRKEEVLGATELYIFNEKFPRLPHYFIQKGSGADKTQDILDWIDKYRTANSQSGDNSYNALM